MYVTRAQHPLQKFVIIQHKMHTMANRALVLVRGASTISSSSRESSLFCFSFPISTYPKALVQVKQRSRNYTAKSSLEPPDVPRLAQTARISLTPDEVEEFVPKIQQVVDWFGQLQAVDLQSVEPAIRADTEGDNLRDDSPDIFSSREAIIAAVPSYEDTFIKVPKVLNKE